MATATRADTTRVSNRMGQGCDNHRPRFYGKRESSAHLRLAELWGCSVRQAQARFESCFTDARDVVIELMAHGEHDRLAEKMAPMEAALVAWAGAPALPDAVIAAGVADADEDSAEARYHAQPSRETARALVRKLGRQDFHSAHLQAALIQEWEL